MKPLLMLALAVFFSGCAGRSAFESPLGSDAAPRAEFRDRIDRYIDLHEVSFPPPSGAGVHKVKTVATSEPSSRMTPLPPALCSST